MKNIEDLIDTFENTGDNGYFFIGDYSNIEIATYIRQQKEEIERLKLHIMKIKEVISTWNIENDEGHNEFKIPKKIIEVVWSDEE